VGSATVARGTTVGDTPIGGLSAIAYDAEHSSLLALSDVSAPSRVYTFDLSIEDDALRIRPRDVVLLRDAEGRSLTVDIDPEGMALSPTGHLLIASEYGGTEGASISSAIFEFTRQGWLVRSLPVPEKYRRESRGDRTRGVVFNKGFESLALSPDGRHLFTATETALLQDRRDGSAAGAHARLLEYTERDGSFEPTREEVYPVEPPAAPDDFESFQGENGLVELLASSGTELLALERSFVVETGSDARRTHQRLRLYRVTPGVHPSVLGRFSLLDGMPYTPLEKELLLDFGNGRTGSPALIVDNFEAMTFGPPLADGRRTLILASDDNFSERQVTAFLVFAFAVDPVKY
jgi:hypothetical protein